VLEFIELSEGTDLSVGIDDAGHPTRPVVLIDGDQVADAERTTRLLRRSQAITVLVARQRDVAPSVAAAADLVLAAPGRCAGAVDTDDPSGAAEFVLQRIAGTPTAAVTLAWLLRSAAFADVPGGLAAESAAYSTLLASSEFRRWLSARGRPRPPDGPDRVRLARDGNVLRVTLARPGRRNAVDTLMRGALLQALDLARWDAELRVEIDAEGPSFSAGGDLDEFGTATDPATAHLIRVSASVGQAIHDLRDRVTVHVHGACFGAGIELPAFAGHLVAAPDSRFALPEVAMGAIPGAGGTVSIPRRIGRGRALWFGLTGEVLDAERALAWGLIDEIRPMSSAR
jgi:enoyl-CoA hydratase/carnithine racemase